MLQGRPAPGLRLPLEQLDQVERLRLLQRVDTEQAEEGGVALQQLTFRSRAEHPDVEPIEQGPPPSPGGLKAATLSRKNARGGADPAGSGEMLPGAGNESPLPFMGEGGEPKRAG